MNMKIKIISIWIVKVIIAVILLQTLFFKFTAHPDSVLLFSELGIEPWGRILLGIIELFVAVGILIPSTAFFASMGAVILMVGAIFSHLFFIGVVFNDDGGGLFILAVVTFILSLIVAYFEIKKK